jgi:hypothetical protein
LAEKQTQRRFVDAGNIEDRRHGLDGIARLLPVVVALEAGGGADRRVIFETPPAGSLMRGSNGGRRRAFGARAAGLDACAFASQPYYPGRRHEPATLRTFIETIRQIRPGGA